MRDQQQATNALRIYRIGVQLLNDSSSRMNGARRGAWEVIICDTYRVADALLRTGEPIVTHLLLREARAQAESRGATITGVSSYRDNLVPAANESSQTAEKSR